MATDDAVRWNRRYESAPAGWFANPRSFLVEHLDLLPKRGLALDLAMGPGQNAAILVDRGLEVIGVDVSSSAVQLAKARSPRIMAAIVDLNHFYLPSHHFDVVLNFYYLQRSMFPEFARILKPGGFLVFETLTRQMLQLQPDLDPSHLVEEGELTLAFKGWDILIQREGWVVSDHGNQKATASLIARLPERNQDQGHAST